MVTKIHLSFLAPHQGIMKIRYLTICLIGSMSIFFVGNLAKAQTGSLGISVAPQVFEMDVFAGETIHQKILVGNLSEVALPLSARPADFTAAEDSGEMLFEEDSQDLSFASRLWFKFEKPNVILDPGEKRWLEFSINVPANAEPGGHYSVVLFEPQLPSFYFREGQPRAIPVVGALFLISVKTLSLEPILSENKIAISEFGIPKEQRLQILEKALSSVVQIIPKVSAQELNIVEKTPTSFILRIKNNDIYHHKLEGKLLIYNSFGKKVGETEIKRTTILPKKVRKFPVNFSLNTTEKIKWLPASISNFFSQNTSLGKYRVVLELGEEKSQIELNRSFNFWAFPWKIILPLFFVLIVLILIRKRIPAAIKILMGRKPL